MSRTTVHLVRHGEVHNPDGILYGRLPGFELSTRGQQQAQQVAAWTEGQDIAVVVASPMLRAQQTAAPTAAAHGVAVDTDERLIEAGNAFEGQRFAVGDGALRHPENWPLLRNPFLPSWGEPYLEIARRMLGAATRARGRAEGHVAVCVSHQLPIWTLRRFLSGERLWHNPTSRQCALGSVTSLVFDDETLVDLAYTEPAGTGSPSPHRSQRGRRRVRALLVTLVALLALAGCSTAPSADNGFTFSGTGGRPEVTYDPPASRGVLPAVSGDDLLGPGTVLSTDAFRGRVVVLNVWGSWCGPCRGEADGLEQVARASAARGVQFVGVDVRDDRDAASDFVRDRGISYPSIFDPPGRSLLALRGYPRNAVPSTVVLDRSHRVAAVILTAVTPQDLQGTVDRVAAEPATA